MISIMLMVDGEIDAWKVMMMMKGEKAERAVRWVVATTSGCTTSGPPLVGAPHASNEQSTPSLRRGLGGILYY